MALEDLADRPARVRWRDRTFGRCGELMGDATTSVTDLKDSKPDFFNSQNAPRARRCANAGPITRMS